MKYYVEFFSVESGETISQIEFDTDEICAHIVPEGKNQKGLLFDTVQLRIQQEFLPCGHPESSLRVGGCGEGCIECAQKEWEEKNRYTKEEK